MVSYARIAEIAASGRPAVLVTVVESADSAPRSAGARMLVFDDGTIEGTVGGGALESRARELAATAMRGSEARLAALDLAADLGMSCGGRVALFVEPLNTAPTLVIFGAGHIGLAVARLAQSVGFRLIVVDDRPEYASRDRFPEAQQVVTSFAPEAMAALPTGDACFVVIATYSHEVDFRIANALAPWPYRFVGMVASRRKVAEFRARWAEAGVPASAIARLQAPVGIAIDAETPQEIALSIVAELVRLRRQRPRPAALIAAAGDSSRLGYPKALLRLDGESFVRRLVRVLRAAGAAPCIVTVPPAAAGSAIRTELADVEALVVENGAPQQGLIGSIRTALGLVERASALLVAPVDCPFVDVELARSLLGAAVDPDAIAVPVVGDRIGHPVVFGSYHFAALRSPASDTGAAALVQAAGAHLVRVASAEPRVIDEVNTPADAQRLGIAIG
ncbi:MAG: XdhC family protein [Deltaproteobacteria bacterium]|nr:XdhC family protein [Deltaproteobacteria bacterium]